MRLLATARDLKRRRARERTSLVLVEGVRAVEELLASQLTTRGALVSPMLARTSRGDELRERLSRATPSVVEVTDAELASASDTDTPQGVIVIAERPEHTLGALEPGTGDRILVLDGIQDPGNVGSMIRTAEAMGVLATVALPGTVDLWNPKVVRGAMGSIFRHPAIAATPAELRQFANERDVELWNASAAGEPISASMSTPARLAIVVGNEGSGVSREVAAMARRTISIPMTGVESLNVAVATGILLYALRKA